MRRKVLPRGLACAVVVAAMTVSTLASADRAGPEPPPVIEAELHLVWGESLGRSPILMPGVSFEWGLGSRFSVVVGGLAAVASSTALPFVDETIAGGGLNGAFRFYFRGARPRGFGIGAAMTWLVLDGVAIAGPRGEAFYRFVVFRHLTIRIHASVGGLLLWDTAPADQRPGPTANPSRYATDDVSGIWIGFGLAFGWAP